MSSYTIIISICVILILSFFFNIIAKKTNIPSVLMLLVTGIVIKQVLIQYNLDPDLDQALEILGIIGLILIVLEAALDLKISKDKLGLILKATAIAVISLGVCATTFSLIFKLSIQNLDWINALMYATPLSILSSAIVIPSVSSLKEHKKELLIYESTISDILGIMLFYMVIGNADSQSGAEVVMDITLNLSLTFIVSIVSSVLLLLLFQNMRYFNTRFALFFSILILLYAIGKSLHLSSLIIILIFGLILSNHKFLAKGRLGKIFKKENIDHIFDDFKMMTEESAFLVRTMFFIFFGMSITLSSALSLQVISTSLIFIAIIYGSRYLILRYVIKENFTPELYIAPRGLISVLLFYSIPESFQVNEVESGILFFIIIITSTIMGVALVKDKIKKSHLK